jgi:hypothetical protein
MSVISPLNSPLYTTFPLFTPLFPKYLSIPSTALPARFGPSSGHEGSKKPALGKEDGLVESW